MTDDIPAKKYILDLHLDELKDVIASFGEPPYRAEQVFQWIYRKRVHDFSKMSNLSKQLRPKLEETFSILSSHIKTILESRDGTTKYLLDFGDNRMVESVLIPAKDHLTACLSTQFGCPVGCAFCASGQAEFGGNLSAGNIVEQLLRLQVHADKTSERISNIVFMGMGEPFLNYDNLIKSIHIIKSDWGLNIGARKITISTVGIPKQIRRLAEEKLQVNLAISLHSVNQKKREELIPMAKSHSLDEILDSTYEYFRKTHREVTLEYLLIKDLNCSGKDADKLAEIAKKIRSCVNIIVYNPTEHIHFEPPGKQIVDNFIEHLKKKNVNVHIRASRGSDIDAACGQLRKREEAPDGGYSNSL